MFGQPEDLKTHGMKFKVDDNCENDVSRIFLTIYKTGKMLIQAEGNKHSLSSHFVDNHLEALYIQVYNKKKLQKTLTS